MKKVKRVLYGLPAAVVGAVILFGISAAQALTVAKPTNLSNQPITIASGSLQTTSDVTSLFCGVLNWIFWGLIVLAVIMFLVGGYKYATSGGEPEKTGSATKTLTYAAIAVVIALIAAGVPSIINSFFNSGNASSLTAC